MMGRFLASAGLGFSTSLSCAVTCLPVYLLFGVSADGKRDLASLGMLLSGRLAAYLLMGALAGALGSAFRVEVVTRLSALAILPLCLLLFLRASGVFTREIRLCGLLARAGERVRSPLLVGFLLGFSVCYPFLIAIAEAATAGLWGGIAVFGGFFVGTSAFLAPLLLLPLVRGRGFREWLGRAAPAAAGVMALFYLARALAILVPPVDAPAAATRADVEKLFPEATAIEKVEVLSPRHYRAFSGPEGDRNLLGYAVESLECAPDIVGYAGPVPLLVALDPRGSVLAVAVLANRETPSYTTRIFSREFLARFAGATARDRLRIGADVDAVSGSTVSLEALTGALRATLQVFSMKILRIEPPTAPAPASSRLDPRIPAVLAMTALSVAVLLFAVRFRNWFLPAAVLVLGVLFPSFVGISDVVKPLFGVGFGAGEAVPRLLALGVAVGVTAAFGRHYCSFLCPYGALQELVHAVSPLQRDLSPWLDKILRSAKYVLLLAVPFLYALGRGFGAIAFEPFDATFRAFRDPASLAALAATALPLLLLAALLLAANLVTERFYCKYLCPLGALFAVLATARILPKNRFMIPGRTCAGCSKGLPDFEPECFHCGGRKP